MIVLSLPVKRYVVAALVGLFSLLINAGCSPSTSLIDDWSDYQQRIATPQQIDPSPWQLTPAAAYPARRELRLELPPIQLSLLDSFRLDDCRAGALIAERNSSLGRLQQGLIRYYHDVQLVSALEQCSADLPPSELRQRLTEVSQQKRAALPLLRAEAVLQDNALRVTLSPGKTALLQPDPALLAPLLQALTVVMQTLDSEHAAQLPARTELDAALETLEKSSYSGQLWRGLVDQRQLLEQLAPLLIDSDLRAGCRSAGVPERAHILRNVAIKIFAGELQPRLALYLQQAQAFDPYLQALQELDAHPALTAYLRQLRAQPESLRQAVRRHVELWQILFHACGFSPQQNATN